MYVGDKRQELGSNRCDVKIGQHQGDCLLKTEGFVGTWTFSANTEKFLGKLGGISQYFFFGFEVLAPLVQEESTGCRSISLGYIGVISSLPPMKYSQETDVLKGRSVYWLIDKAE